MQMHVRSRGWTGACKTGSRSLAPGPPPTAGALPSPLPSGRAAPLTYRLVPLSPSTRLVPAMEAPQPPPSGPPLSCGNARMLPLPAAPAHKCGRRAKGACEAGERWGERASRARARRDALPEGDGRCARPPGGARWSSGRVNPASRR